MNIQAIINQLAQWLVCAVEERRLMDQAIWELQRAESAINKCKDILE